ncbi:MAG: ATP-binding protein [Bacteroidota bacterium]
MNQIITLKKLFLLASLGLALPLFLWGQQAKVDSLQRVLASEIHDTLRLSILEDLYDHYIETNLDSSLLVVNQFFAVAEQSGVKKYTCQGYNFLGTVQRKMNVEMDTVLATLERALSCCESAEDSSCRLSALNGIGGLYHRSGMHAKAMNYYQQVIELAEAAGDTVRLIAGLGNTAGILKRRLEFDKSLIYSRKALSLAEAIGHQSYIGLLTNNIANIYFDHQKYDSALVLYEQALAIKREAGSKLSLAITLANVGGIHVAEKRFEIGQRYLDESYSIAAAQNYPYGLALSLRFMAFSAISQERYNQAIGYANEGLLHLGQRGAVQYARDFHLNLSEAFENLNQTDSALAHLKTARIINDSLFQSEKEAQIQQLEISYQVREKDNKNQLLETRQALTAQQLKSRTYIGLGLLVALFFAAAWGFSLLRNNRERRKMNELLELEVEERTQELQVANEQLQQANYELRSFNHIASHDLKEPIRNVGNYVGLIHRRLPAELKDKLKDYFDIIHKSTSQLYTLIEDIASYSQLSNDDMRSLSTIDLTEMVGGIKAGLEAFIATKNGKVVYAELPSIESNSSLLFVILKNLIENGLKFNEAVSPTIKVDYQSGSSHHQIVVSDNGIGIDPEFHEHIFTMFKRLHSMGEYPGTGIGLAMVKLGVEKLGGTVALDSELGKGSTFTIELPKHRTVTVDETTVKSAGEL